MKVFLIFVVTLGWLKLINANEFIEPPPESQAATHVGWSYSVGQKVYIQWTSELVGTLNILLGRLGEDTRGTFEFNFIGDGGDLPNSLRSFVWKVPENLPKQSDDVFKLSIFSSGDGGTFRTVNFTINHGDTCSENCQMASSASTSSSQSDLQASTAAVSITAISTQSPSSLLPSTTTVLKTSTYTKEPPSSPSPAPALPSTTVVIIAPPAQPSASTSHATKFASQISSETSSSSSSITAPPGAGAGAGGLSEPAKIGIGVGVPLGLLALAGLLFLIFLVVRKRRRRDDFLSQSIAVVGGPMAGGPIVGGPITVHKVGEWRAELHSTSTSGHF